MHPDALAEELDTPIEHDQREFEPLSRTSSRHVGDERWTEVRLFKHKTEALYRVLITGRTLVEGEVDRTKLVDTPSPEVLVRALTVKYRLDETKRWLPDASRRALIEAAELDEHLAEFIEDIVLDAPLDL